MTERARWQYPPLLAVLVMGLMACGQHAYHRVEPGDTLYSISWEYGHDYKVVAEWNNIGPPYTIRAGQVIRLTPPRREDGWTLLAKKYEPVETEPEKDEAPSPRRTPKSSTDKNTGNPSRRETRQPPRPPAAVTPVTWQWPASGEVATAFRASDPSRKGIDIAGRVGQKVYAAAGGRVVYSGNGLKGYGNLVIIKHNKLYLSAYAHNQHLFVEEGDHVKVGQHIADMGRAPNRNPLLHFEIRRDGKPVDPLRHLPSQSR